MPAMRFIMLDGKGEPGGSEYQNAVGALYALSWTIKMSKMGAWKIDGYYEYTVPPLEGLWSSDGPFDFNKRDRWRWTSMIRQPDFVTDAVFAVALAQARQKKPAIDFSGARFETFTEGLCVQMMPTGPYAEEPATVEALHKFIGENGLTNMTGDARRHHEIYLSDPRKTKQENLKTVLWLPVE